MEQVRGQGSSVLSPDSHSVAGSRYSCAIKIIAARHTWLIKAQYSGTSLVAQTVKNPPALRETRVPSLGQEHPLGKGTSYPLQSSCLGDPMGRGAWWATVRGVAKSRTRLSEFHYESQIKRETQLIHVIHHLSSVHTLDFSGCHIRWHGWRRCPSSWTALPCGDAREPAQSWAHRGGRGMAHGDGGLGREGCPRQVRRDDP